MLPTARRACTWGAGHSRRTMVDRLDFVTAAGGMYGVVTPVAVLVLDGDRLSLDSWRPDIHLAEVAGRTGFPLDTGKAARTLPPTSAERAALHALDPEGSFELTRKSRPRKKRGAQRAASLDTGRLNRIRGDDGRGNSRLRPS